MGGTIWTQQQMRSDYVHAICQCHCGLSRALPGSDSMSSPIKPLPAQALESADRLQRTNWIRYPASNMVSLQLFCTGHNHVSHNVKPAGAKWVEILQRSQTGHSGYTVANRSHAYLVSSPISIAVFASQLLLSQQVGA